MVKVWNKGPSIKDVQKISTILWSNAPFDFLACLIRVLVTMVSSLHPFRPPIPRPYIVDVFYGWPLAENFYFRSKTSSNWVYSRRQFLITYLFNLYPHIYIIYSIWELSWVPALWGEIIFLYFFHIKIGRYKWTEKSS